ncbi:MAG: PUA domain-containing protein [Thermoproteus sp.]
MTPEEQAYGLLTYIYGHKNIKIDKNKIVVKYNKSKRIKYIYYGDKPIFAYRNNDGYLLPLADAARYLKAPYVVVDGETAKFVAQGRSVPAKFIKGHSKGVRPNEEVLIVAEDGTPTAIGRLIYSIRELSLGRGYAVKPRVIISNLDKPEP